MAKKAGKKKATKKATKKKAAKAKVATTKPKAEKKKTAKKKPAKPQRRGVGPKLVHAADTVVPGPWDTEKMLAHALQLLTNRGIAPDERQACINRLFTEGGAEEWWNKVAPKHLKT